VQDGEVRLAEVMASWALAIDVGMGAPLETGLRICHLATGLARAAGADEDTCRRTYDLALVRHIGCTVGSRQFADIVGDEVAFRGGIGGRDPSNARELMPYVLKASLARHPWTRKPGALVRLLREAPQVKELGGVICEVGQMLVGRLGLGTELQRDLALVYERYDGKGFPHRVPAEEITLPAQCVHLADAVIANLDAGGPQHAVDMVLERRGKAFAPDLSDVFLLEAPSLVADSDDVWDQVLTDEPGPGVRLDEAHLDIALQAFADFVDLKSSWTTGHSRDVASLAGEAAAMLGLPHRTVRRAGWLHDAGRLSVSVLVWEKETPLSREEWEQVRLHAYWTERVFARPASLAALGALAGQHHERMNGSGYHRGASTPTPEAAVLAAADVYAALVAARPHREAFTPIDAAKAVRWEVEEGRLSAEAADAVLKVAGHRTDRRTTAVAGLTKRELEVLRLVARGRSTKEIAAVLVVSPRTVEHHVEAIYAKAGVRSRGAAAMFAMQNGLVSELDR
jgi:HD-GYP domain-containing protein (c-di-GMP phosphodiesterase class II)